MVGRSISYEAKCLAATLLLEGKVTFAYLERKGIASRRTMLRFLRSGQTRQRKPTGRKRALPITTISFLNELVLRNPGLYLDEIRAILLDLQGQAVSISTIFRALERSNFSLKRAHKVAKERCDHKRAEYQLRIGQYQPRQLVFADETSYDARTAVRVRARSLRGHHARLDQPYVRGARFSCIAALSEIGCFAPRATAGSFNERRFLLYLEHDLLPQMQPFPAARSVLVLDNASIHKTTAVREMVERFGCKLEFLSPYSPDFNPIERAFAKIKSHLRRQNEEEADADFFVDAFQTITSQDCVGWMRLAGYL